MEQQNPSINEDLNAAPYAQSEDLSDGTEIVEGSSVC